MASDFPQGVVHDAGDDLQAALRAEPAVFDLWKALTPLGRNAFICWVEDAKQAKTRQRRIERTVEELLEGKKRPCCWVGCIHRTDKAPSPWQQAVLIDGKAKDRPPAPERMAKRPARDDQDRRSRNSVQSNSLTIRSSSVALFHRAMDGRGTPLKVLVFTIE